MTSPQPISIPGAAARIYRSAPELEGRKTLAIGGVKIDDADAGIELLEQIETMAREEGYAALLLS